MFYKEEALRLSSYGIFRKFPEITATKKIFYLINEVFTRIRGGRRITDRNQILFICAKLSHLFRSSHSRCFVKKMFLKNSQNSQENTCARVAFLIKLQVEVQVFSYEVCEIFKNTSFTEHLRTTASDSRKPY